MVFKAVLGDTANQENSPLAFTFAVGNNYCPMGLANLEFIGFSG